MITLSAAGLVQGQSFTCTSSYCEAIGVINAGIFKGLQTALNAVAARLGLRDTISVDGKIGQRTVDLLQLIAISIPISLASPLNTYWSTTKEEISRDAPSILAECGLLLQRLPASGSQPPLSPGAGPTLPSSGSKPSAIWASTIVSTTPGIAPPVSPIAPPQQASADPLLPSAPSKYVIAGLVGFGLLAIGTTVLLTRRKSKPVGCARCR